MKIYELFETKTAATGKKLVVPASKPRNPFGKQPKTSGAGSHRILLLAFGKLALPTPSHIQENNPAFPSWYFPIFSDKHLPDNGRVLKTDQSFLEVFEE